MSNGRAFGRRRRERLAQSERIAYGATCTWWDSIDKVHTTGTGLPCCPRCHGVLYEVADEATWWKAADRYAEEHGEDGYRAMMEWARGRCFPAFAVLVAAYHETAS